jgi:transposase
MGPPDHLLRRLEAVVDLAFVRELCAGYYSRTGQPSIDPVVLFKMMLLGYLYGITSERRLAEECALHLAFRWYLGYDLDEPTPDHSVLSKARARHGQAVFEAFFQRVLKLCSEAHLLQREKIFADSTLVIANASLKSLVSRDQLFQPTLSPWEHLEQVFSENPSEGSLSPERTPAVEVTSHASSAPVPNTTAASLEGEAPTVSTRLQPLSLPTRPRGGHAKRRRAPNSQRVSRADPEASLTARRGLGIMLAYKQHFTVDSHRRVVTAVEVTPAAAQDPEQVPRLLDQQPLPPQEFCADSHYGVPKVYAELRRRGIWAAIPRCSPQSRRPKPGRLSTAAFRYVPEGDVYLCPQGRELRRVAYEARWDRYHYRPRESDCRSCPLRLACSTPKTVRTVIRYSEQETLEWAEAYLTSPQGRQTWAQRGVIAEGIVAEAKGFHGLRRALHRGLAKFKIQALLIASVQNLKRLVRAGDIPPASPLSRSLDFILRELSVGLRRSEAAWAVAQKQ